MMTPTIVFILVVTLIFTVISGWLTRRALKRPADEFSLQVRPAAWEREGGTDLSAPIIPATQPAAEAGAGVEAKADADTEAASVTSAGPATALKSEPAAGSDSTAAVMTAKAAQPARPARPAQVPLTAAHDIVPAQRLFDEVARGLEKIPPLPKSVHLILKELESAGSTAKSIGEILSGDPVIGAALLRVVNSAAVGLRRRVLTVHDAVSYLGFSTVRGIVLRLKLAGFLPQSTDQRQCYNMAALWVHSTAVSAVADVLARRISWNPMLRVDPALASTLGLLHDIGKLAINSRFPEKVAALRTRSTAGADAGIPADESLLGRERRLFGADHAFMGGFLAAQWRLPDELADAIRLHHVPVDHTHAVNALPAELRRAVVVVHVANQVVKYRHVYCEDMEIDIVAPDLLGVMGFPGDVEELLDDEVVKALTDATAIAHELGAVMFKAPPAGPPRPAASVAGPRIAADVRVAVLPKG